MTSAVYWTARTLVAAAGLCLIVLAVFIPMVSLVPAAAATRTAGLLLGLPIALLMLCPNRLTLTGRRFKYRMIASCLVGLCFVITGLGAIPPAFGREHERRILVDAFVAMPLGISLPACLWWRVRQVLKLEKTPYPE